MFQIYPQINQVLYCPDCSGRIKSNGIVWQGVHVCSNGICISCGHEFLCDLPTGQGTLERFQMRKSDGNITGSIPFPWLVNSLKEVLNNPLSDEVKVDIKYINKCPSEVIILNTMDNCYGHSLLYLLNLEKIIKYKGNYGLIVIIQPFLKWLLPTEGIDEIWTVNLSLGQLRNYYMNLNSKINDEITRFDKVFLSSANVGPKNVTIKSFTKIAPYNFDEEKQTKRVTFIWREDVSRLWFKSWLFYGGLRKLNLAKILLPFHYLRVLFFLYLLNNKLKNDNYIITLAGLGNYGWFPKYVKDERVKSFNYESELSTCNIYAESELVIGIHGSSMILPSAHAGMTICIMPSKRWGNYAEDIIFTGDDPRTSSFEKRIIPMNTTIYETRDIVLNMLKGHKYFLKKMKDSLNNL